MAYQVADDALELTEPAFDAPPTFREADERRLHVRAYNHWASLLRGRAFPSLADLDPEGAGDFGPNGVLIDLRGGAAGAPTLRFVGRSLREECGLAPGAAGLDEVPERSLLSRLTDHHAEILARRAPIGFEAEFVSHRALRTLYRGILMPLSSDGRTIDFVHGVINWKEVAGVDLAAGLVAEVAEALAAARRTERAEAPEDRARARLRGRPAAARVALPAPGTDEFVLLVARREADGALAVLEPVPDGERLVEAALRRLGSPPCPRPDEVA